MTSKHVIGNTSVGAGRHYRGGRVVRTRCPTGWARCLVGQRVPSIGRALNATSTSLVPRESRVTSRASFWGHRAAAQRDFRGLERVWAGPSGRMAVYREGNAKHTSKIGASPDPA
jgi:hypothetical protein